VRWPGLTAGGSVCATPIIAMDYFPTLLEVAGKSAKSEKVDGQSLVPLLRGRTIPERTLFWDYPHYGEQGGAPASGVREGKWKLIVWRENGAVELFDLEADPGERNDLANTQPDVVSRLRSKLGKWRKEVGAKAPTPNPKFHAAAKASSNRQSLAVSF
jgi:arylsulfatase A-like enzyme